MRTTVTTVVTTTTTTTESPVTKDKATETRYSVAEAVQFIQSAFGTSFGSLYTVLADQRRTKHKHTRLPFVEFHRDTKGHPYYLHSDLLKLVADVRSMRTTSPRRATVKPCRVHFSTHHRTAPAYARNFA